MQKKVQVWLPLLFSITLVLGMLIGYKLRDNIPGRNFFSLEHSRPVQEVLDIINSKYVDDIKLDELNDTAIVAILSKLDPHSVFIPAEELQQVNEDIAGNFFGIGVEFNVFNDTVNITNVIPEGPSAKAGIQTGDKFIKVGDSLIAGNGINADKVRKLLKGNLDSKVSVTLLRGSNKMDVTITRGIIPVSSVDASYMYPNGIGYIRLNKFSQVTYREFMKSLEDLQKQGLKKLILDLRDNGGGVLDEATAIADEFLDGDKLITYTEGKHFPKKEYRCKKPGLFEKGELVVLANEGTASASEILIGALQDWDRATVIGRRSFGKGLVQEQYDLSNGSALRLTIARYYTPIGRSIQRPYEKGGKAYYEEIANRFHDGEVISADSIKNDTTKVYKTISGKKVYGGGGITPDIFVAVDTSDYGPVSTKVYTKGTINVFAYQFYLQHRDELKKYKDPTNFVQEFRLKNEDWQWFSNLASKDSISVSVMGEKEKNALQLRICSLIARQIWRNEGYFEMLNSNDDAVRKAVELLEK